MAKIIIEINDTPSGRTDVRCSTRWAELQAKRTNRALAPGAEQLTVVALNAIQRFVDAEAKRLFQHKPGVRQ